MDNLKITDMKVSDLQEITGIYDTDFPNSWKISTLESELNNSSSQYIVARLDYEIVGFAGLWYSIDDVHITNIVVKNKYRNMRIGNELLKRLIEIVEEKGKKCLTLEVNTKNIYAQKLYNKYNFKTLGIRKKYYNGIDDAYIMTLYL